MKLPTELELTTPDDVSFRVRFDYDRGEPQWFDARAGVGSPGYDPSVSITEVNFGAGWRSPEEHQSADVVEWEQKVMDRLVDLESAENAARDEAEYNAWNEKVTT